MPKVVAQQRPSGSQTHDLSIASPTLYPQRHCVTSMQVLNVIYEVKCALTLFAARGCARNHDVRMSSLVCWSSKPCSWARRRALWTPVALRRRHRASTGQSSPTAPATYRSAAISPAVAVVGIPALDNHLGSDRTLDSSDICIFMYRSLIAGAELASSFVLSNSVSNYV